MMIGCAENADCGATAQTETLSNKNNNASKTNLKYLFIFRPTRITRKFEMVPPAHHPGLSRRVNSNNQNSLNPVYPACPTCPVKCELLVFARLFNRDEIFFAFISSGLNPETVYPGETSVVLVSLVQSLFFRGSSSKWHRGFL